MHIFLQIACVRSSVSNSVVCTVLCAHVPSSSVMCTALHAHVPSSLVLRASPLALCTSGPGLSARRWSLVLGPLWVSGAFLLQGGFWVLVEGPVEDSIGKAN